MKNPEVDQEKRIKRTTEIHNPDFKNQTDVIKFDEVRGSKGNRKQWDVATSLII